MKKKKAQPPAFFPTKLRRSVERARSEKGLSTAYICYRIGDISDSTLYAWMAGDGVPDLNALMAMNDLFEWGIPFRFDDEEQPKRSTGTHNGCSPQTSPNLRRRARSPVTIGA